MSLSLIHQEDDASATAVALVCSSCPVLIVVLIIGQQSMVKCRPIFNIYSLKNIFEVYNRHR
jgi:hypothetical protein